MKACRYELLFCQWEVDRQRLLWDEEQKIAENTPTLSPDDPKVKQYRLAGARYSEKIAQRALEARDLARKYMSKHKAIWNKRNFWRVYGQMECRPLCEAVATKLPRELRDMIYDWNLNTSPLELLPPLEEFPFFHRRFLPRGDRYIEVYTKKHMTSLFRHGILQEYWQWWNSSYVGAAVFKELSETCYRVKIFIFTKQAVDLLPEFMGFVNDPEHDTPSALVLPLNYIRHVLIGIEPRDRFIHSQCCERAEAQVTALRNLAHLKPGATIEIAIQRNFRFLYYKDWDLQCLYQDEWVLHLCKQLWPLLQSLRQHGHMVTVGIDPKFANTLRDASLLPEEWVEIQ